MQSLSDEDPHCSESNEESTASIKIMKTIKRKNEESAGDLEMDSTTGDEKNHSLSSNDAKKLKKEKSAKSKSIVGVTIANEKSADLLIEEEPEDDDDNMFNQDSGSEDSDTEEQASDPYLQHFQYVLPEECTEENLTLGGRRIQPKLAEEDALIKMPGIGYMNHYKMFENLPTPSLNKKDLDEFHLKKNLLASVKRHFSEAKKKTDFRDENFNYELSFLNMLTNYMDVMYYKQYYQSRVRLRRAYSIHILNHILKSKARVIHHNSKLKKNSEAEYRDQGFTQPTVLVLAPFKGDCHLIVNQILSLLPVKCKVMNKARFEEEYGSSVTKLKNRPEDFYEIFEGDQDEDFKIGLRIQNEHVTLFSDFYKSDLIIASPLGLKCIIGGIDNKKGEADFLSSIEVLIVDRIDVLFVQNKVFLHHVLACLNHLVKGNNKKQKINYFRVREYFLDKKSKYYRQTIFLASAENRFFERHQYINHCFNYKGYLKSFDLITHPMIKFIYPAMEMRIRFFDADNPKKDFLDRRNFFQEKILPEFLNDKSTVQTLIYVPCYFDFVQLRQIFRKAGISCFMLAEDTDKGKVAEGRNLFYKGARHFMLYTERAHFYYRRAIKGIQHIIFYDLPTFPKFFREMCNSLMDSHPNRKYEQKTCTVLVNKWNFEELKYIVGLEEASRIVKSSNQKTFIQCIGS